MVNWWMIIWASSPGVGLFVSLALTIPALFMAEGKEAKKVIPAMLYIMAGIVLLFPLFQAIGLF